ncbi:hypothetical protein [Fibrobacter sp. UWEL]|uniref:hypothetical protein n=1 Tax=Fibrobacter sp. UWEL TaxID=1896209 RepID=UPI0009215303|nr:hypothetical protein [Fibrobacter sp. UWEL]SHK44305.1 hypothetical protein SAMN05720468_10266 [Fibrobacter sp. UWEL]
MMKRLIVLALFLASFLFAEETAQEPAFLANSQPSKKELYSRAREALKEALENKDMERAATAFEYLQAGVSNGAPLNRFEEYLIYSELNRYDEAIREYANRRRLVMDSSYTPEQENRITVEDNLSKYLYRGLKPFTPEIGDSLYNRAVQSDASQENKDLYGVLLAAEHVIGIQTIEYGSKIFFYRVVRDTIRAEDFLKRAKEFVWKYPMSEHAEYLKNQTIPFVQGVMDEERLFARDPWAHKYYTGGLGVYAGKWLGFLSGEATDYLRDRMGTSFYVEAELQIKRFSLGVFWSFGLVTKPKFNYQIWGTYEDESVGVTLGYTAFDSRFLKVTPFLGYGSTDLETMEMYIDPQYILGVNIDSHLIATRPSHMGAISFGLNVRFKYMMQIGTFDDSETMSRSYKYDDDGNRVRADNIKGIEATAINHTFALELGLIAW